MIIDSLCPPAVLYLGFSLIQIIIDLFRGQQNSAFLKVIVMIVFTILLNQLCMGGLTILSWFIVFIPFIMMTYVTTILLYVFGLNPSKGKIQPQQPDPRGTVMPTPSASSNKIGGCATTLFGCCPNGVTAKNVYGSNCNYPKPAKWHRSHQGSHYYPHRPTTKPTTKPSTTPTPTSTTKPSTTPTPTSTTEPSTTPTPTSTTNPITPK